MSLHDLVEVKEGETAETGTAHTRDRFGKRSYLEPILGDSKIEN